MATAVLERVVQTLLHRRTGIAPDDRQEVQFDCQLRQSAARQGLALALENLDRCFDKSHRCGSLAQKVARVDGRLYPKEVMKPRMRGRRIGVLHRGPVERARACRCAPARPCCARSSSAATTPSQIFVDSRPRSRAARRADRRRVFGAARPLRRGRLRPGPARAARHPLHRLGRAGVGAGDGQAQGQGAVPPAQPADAALLRASTAAKARPRRAARHLRLPVAWSSRAREGIVARRAPRRRRRRARAAPSRRRCASTTTCWSSASSTARRSRRGPRRPRARRRRDRPARGLLRLRSTSHTRGDDRLLSCRRACRPSGCAACSTWRCARACALGCTGAVRGRHRGLRLAATSTCSRSTRCRR